MKLNHKAVEYLLASRGWSEVQFAAQLNMDYSYIYRVMRNQRGIGIRFITQFIHLCENEGLDFKEFVHFD